VTAESFEPLPDRQDEGLAGADGALTPRERAAVIHRIRTLVEYWGITAEELSQPDAPPAPSPEPAAPLPAKYRHPTSGETWDGQGAHPQWLRDALLKEGFTVEELRRAAAASQA
jgi:DNA-binding protein H-NS